VNDPVNHSSQRVRVRAKQCHGCLFGPQPVVRDYQKGRERVSADLANDPTRGFPCHCNHDENHPEKSPLCRGFYEAHKHQLPPPRFIEEEGNAEFWKDKIGLGILF
jgi:hypothetical protein